MIHVIVLAYDCMEWLPKSLISVFEQDYKDFDITIVDDASTDGKQRVFLEDLGKTRDNISVIQNNDNVKACRNIWNAIKHIGPDPEDIIFLLDGDDWLPDSDILTKIADAYDQNTWMTYGSYSVHPIRTLEQPAEPYPDEIIYSRSFRSWVTIFNHPITFKAFLWDEIEESDLQDNEGNWFRTCYDQAIMYPMMEIAGTHCKFLYDDLYVYNATNPASESIIFQEESARESGQMRSRPPKQHMIRQDGMLFKTEDFEGVAIRNMVGENYIVSIGPNDDLLVAKLAAWPQVTKIITVDQDWDKYQFRVERSVCANGVLPVRGDFIHMLKSVLRQIPQSLFLLEQDIGRGFFIHEAIFQILARDKGDHILIDRAELYGTRDGYPYVDQIQSQVSQITESLEHSYELSVSGDVIAITPV